MNSRRLLITLPLVLIALAIALPSSAAPSGEYFPAHAPLFDSKPDHISIVGRPWHVTFDAATVTAPLHLDAVDAGGGAHESQRPQAFEYSDVYNLRRKIHMVASYATIPIFAGQYLAGEKLLDDADNSTAKSAHGALTIGVAALFAVNTVTGVWNLWEARKDPNGRTRRLVHGLMMLAANAGFVATGAVAPDDDDSSGRSTHRALAIGSMGMATATYVYMLVTR